MQPARFSASLLILLATLRCAIAQLAFEIPQQLEHSRSIPFPSFVLVAKALPGGGVIAQSQDWLVLTNDLSTVQTYSPLILRAPFALHPDGGFAGTGDATHCVWRVRADGTKDESFLSPAVSPGDTAFFRDIVVQSDGKVVVACSIPQAQVSIFHGVNDGMFRLNPDGSDDSTFRLNPKMSTRWALPLSDGKILIGNGFRRLLPNGEVDSLFAGTVDGGVDAAALQPDGKIVILGNFSRVNGIRRGGLARLNSDGSLDFTFDSIGSSGFALAIQTDGKILTASSFFISRFLSNGELDETFSILRGSEPISGFALDASQRIYYSEANTVYQYSGRYRVRVPSAEIPVVLERSSFIDTGWSPLQTIPANTAFDYLDSNFPGIGNTFYRMRPAQ